MPGVPYSPEAAAIMFLLEAPNGLERLKLALDCPALVEEPDNVPYVAELKRSVAAYEAGLLTEATDYRRGEERASRLFVAVMATLVLIAGVVVALCLARGQPTVDDTILSGAVLVATHGIVGTIACRAGVSSKAGSTD